MKKQFLLLIFFTFGWLNLVAAEPNASKKFDYQIDLNKRKTFWLPVSGHGWLYEGCDVTLFEPLPEYADSGEPILAGKEDSHQETHFLFRFRFAGYYQFHFFYQSFTEDFSDGNCLPPNQNPLSITLYVYDTRRGFKDSSLVFDSEPLFSAVKLSAKTALPKENFSASPNDLKTAEKIQMHPKNETETSIVKNQTNDQFDNEKNREQSSFLWEKHPLFPDSKQLARLLAESKEEKEPLFSKGAEDPFRLGLYYFTQNTHQGMNEAYRWFCYLVKKYPESEWAREARSRSDYISRYYILVR